MPEDKENDAKYGIIRLSHSTEAYNICYKIKDGKIVGVRMVDNEQAHPEALGESEEAKNYFIVNAFFLKTEKEYNEKRTRNHDAKHTLLQKINNFGKE